MLSLRSKKSSSHSKNSKSPTDKQEKQKKKQKKGEEASKIKAFSYFTSSKTKKPKSSDKSQPSSRTIAACNDDTGAHCVGGIINLETQSSSVSSSGYNSGNNNNNHHQFIYSTQMGANLSSSSPSTAETIAATAANQQHQQQVVGQRRKSRQSVQSNANNSVSNNYSIAGRRRPLTMGMAQPPMVPMMIDDDNLVIGARGDDMNNNQDSTNLIYHLQHQHHHHQQRQPQSLMHQQRRWPASHLIDASDEDENGAELVGHNEQLAVEDIDDDDDDDGGFRQAISLQSHNYQSARRSHLPSAAAASNGHLLAGQQRVYLQQQSAGHSLGGQQLSRSYQHVGDCAPPIADDPNESRRQVIYSAAPQFANIDASNHRRPVPIAHAANGYTNSSSSSSHFNQLADNNHSQYPSATTTQGNQFNDISAHIYQPPIANLRYLRQQHQPLSYSYHHLTQYNNQQQDTQSAAFSQFQPVDFEQYNQEQLKQQQQQYLHRQAMQVANRQPPPPQTPIRTPSRKSQAHQASASSGQQIQHQLTSRSPGHNLNLKTNLLEPYSKKNNHSYQMSHHQHHSQFNAETEGGYNGANNNNERSASSISRKSQAHQQSGRQSAMTTTSQSQATNSLTCCGKLAKLSLFICNLIFWSSGLALGAWGILALVEDHKYNLSQLLVFEPNSRMSLFQLLSWSFITLGCAAILVGFCGCSALFKNNRWILGLYIFLILAIFALDLATGLLAIIFQERLVANVRLRLADKLRNEYGNQASFTAAIDYIQTRYECCGLEGHADYDRSLWRLQRLGGVEAIVARTCCHLRNTFDDQAHVNPRPVNESMCQSADVRFHQSYRYRKGCLNDLEGLIRQKIWTFTIGCGAVGSIILLSLVFATCFCRSIPSQNSRKSSQVSDGQPSAAAVLASAYGNSAMGNHVKSTGGHHRSYR